MSNYTYIVTNKINGKVYVGSHSWDGEGLDPNYYGSGTAITRAVKKYGKDNFQVEVLYYYDTVEECRQDEERILTEYNVKDCPHSYNCKNSAIGFKSEDVAGENNPMYGRTGENNPMYGKKLSDEIRQKISQANKGRTLSDEHRKKLSQALKGEKHPMYGRTGENNPWYGKHHTEEARHKMSQAQNYKKIPVVAIDKNGKVKIFESQLECSRQLNLHLGSIYNCLKGKCKTCGGYIIKYLKRCSTDYKITKRKAKKTEKIKLTTKRKGSTPIVAIHKATGRVRMFLSQRECSRVLGLHKGNVNKCLLGKRKHTGGYAFKKINRDRRVFTASQRSKADLNVLRGITGIA